MTENVITQFDPQTNQNIQSWLEGNYDEETKKTIKKLIKENPKEILDAFYTRLSFGTGGLRGIMGVGINRMNPYTIRATTQGLANYLKKQPLPPNGYSVFIGYDSRNHSREFAEECSKVLAGNGIKTYLCHDLRPTPLVSFGCRFKECSAAIIITASHNPPEYNGYKVYWNDGGQVIAPHDQGIIDEAIHITSLEQVKHVDSLSNKLIEIVKEDVDQAYLEAISKEQLYPEQNRKDGHRLKIIYTNLHGTGITLMPQALANWGFSNVEYVKEQIIPDGNFPTVISPNPEDEKALKMGIECLKSAQADILIATDPDADRVGVVINDKGKITALNGNQIACICLYHICEGLSKQNIMPKNAAFIKSIATTELFKAIANAYGVPCFNVLTGFKYIAEKIRQWEQDPKGYQYIFGGEESYGYLLGTNTHDKDAILSGALICEVALHAKKEGKTLLDLLHEIWKKHGVYVEKLLSINFEESKSGKEQMAKGMSLLENNPPKMWLNIPVTIFEDYNHSIRTFLNTGKTEAIDLPKSNVLVFWLADESKVMVRPSGTEPKIKLYCGVVNRNFSNIPEAINACETHANNLLMVLKAHLTQNIQ